MEQDHQEKVRELAAVWAGAEKKPMSLTATEEAEVREKAASQTAGKQKENRCREVHRINN